jgi:hypothetical protein
MGEPMSSAVLPDRSVLHTARNGVIRRSTAAGATTVIGRQCGNAATPPAHRVGVAHRAAL